MKIPPRAELVLIGAGFALPIVASILAYCYWHPEASANYGELLLPPRTITAQPLGLDGGGRFDFSGLLGRWVLTVSDSGSCLPACADKLIAMRQVRLALGRDAVRVTRVFVIDDLTPPDLEALRPFEGTIVALTPPGMRLPPGAANDRAHIYLVDPHGNVMMRWAIPLDSRAMLRDLQRLLKEIGRASCRERV